MIGEQDTERIRTLQKFLRFDNSGNRIPPVERIDQLGSDLGISARDKGIALRCK